MPLNNNFGNDENRSMYEERKYSSKWDDREYSKKTSSRYSWRRSSKRHTENKDKYNASKQISKANPGIVDLELFSFPNLFRSVKKERQCIFEFIPSTHSLKIKLPNHA